MKNTMINKNSVGVAFNVAPAALFMGGVSGFAAKMSSLRDLILVKVRRTDMIIEVYKSQKNENPEGVAHLHQHSITPAGLCNAWVACLSIIIIPIGTLASVGASQLKRTRNK